MLVLTRKQNQRIWIGDCVDVTVVEIRGDKVRLGIEAPANVAIVRDNAVNQVRRGIADGIPLHAIEADLDMAENAT